jgi:hypothetical protein
MKPNIGCGITPEGKRHLLSIAIADLGQPDVSHRTYEYYAVVFRQPQRTKRLPVPVGAIYNTSFDVVGRSSAVLNIVNSCFGDYTASGLGI